MKKILFKTFFLFWKTPSFQEEILKIDVYFC